MARLKVGDIFRVTTSKGYAYGIYTHRDPVFGALVVLFKGFFSDLPSQGFFEETGEIQFRVFFPLSYALKSGKIKIVGNIQLPKRLQDFPLFRSGLPNPSTHKIDNWWLWDGTREWYVGRLSPEQWELPVKELWNDTLLIENIESGWTIAQHPWGNGM